MILYLFMIYFIIITIWILLVIFVICTFLIFMINWNKELLTNKDHITFRNTNYKKTRYHHRRATMTVSYHHRTSNRTRYHHRTSDNDCQLQPEDCRPSLVVLKQKKTSLFSRHHLPRKTFTNQVVALDINKLASLL